MILRYRYGAPPRVPLAGARRIADQERRCEHLCRLTLLLASIKGKDE